MNGGTECQGPARETQPCYVSIVIIIITLGMKITVIKIITMETQPCYVSIYIDPHHHDMVIGDKYEENQQFYFEGPFSMLPFYHLLCPLPIPLLIPILIALFFILLLINITMLQVSTPCPPLQPAPSPSSLCLWSSWGEWAACRYLYLYLFMYLYMCFYRICIWVCICILTRPISFGLPGGEWAACRLVHQQYAMFVHCCTQSHCVT